jgi:hypothetical protein
VGFDEIHVLSQIGSIKQGCFGFVPPTGHGFVHHLMSIKESMKLLVASFQHAQYLIVRPRVHIE